MGIKVTGTQTKFDKPLEQARLEAGLIGKLFGTDKNAPYNIAGTILIFFIIWAIIAWSLDKSNSIPLLEKIFPIITLTLGYLFGKKA